jgi:RimJ/RimL family protein N-acetyltransferase
MTMKWRSCITHAFQLFGAPDMATASDSSAALQLFQRDLDRLNLTPSATEPGLYFHLDEPQGVTRLAFVRLEGRTVTSLATFFASPPIDGVMVFNGFYAVPAALRNQGRGKDILASALRQMAQGIAQSGVRVIRVELLVEADNVAAQRVAAAVISSSLATVTDQATGRPALLYSTALTHAVH